MISLPNSRFYDIHSIPYQRENVNAYFQFFEEKSCFCFISIDPLMQNPHIFGIMNTECKERWLHNEKENHPNQPRRTHKKFFTHGISALDPQTLYTHCISLAAGGRRTHPARSRDPCFDPCHRTRTCLYVHRRYGAFLRGKKKRGEMNALPLKKRIARFLKNKNLAISIFKFRRAVCPDS